VVGAQHRPPIRKCAAAGAADSKEVGVSPGFPRSNAPPAFLLPRERPPYARLREGDGAMQFRSKIFLVLALIGVVPAAVLAPCRFPSTAPSSSARWGPRRPRSGGSSARLRAIRGAGNGEPPAFRSLLPLRDLSVSDLETVLRIPYRQLEFIDAIWLPGGPLVYEGSTDGHSRGGVAPARGPARAGEAGGSGHRRAVRRPRRIDAVAPRAAPRRGSPAGASCPCAARPQMRQTSQGGTLAYLATPPAACLRSRTRWSCPSKSAR